MQQDSAFGKPLESLPLISTCLHFVSIKKIPRLQGRAGVVFGSHREKRNFQVSRLQASRGHCKGKLIMAQLVLCHTVFLANCRWWAQPLNSRLLEGIDVLCIFVCSTHGGPHTELREQRAPSLSVYCGHLRSASRSGEWWYSVILRMGHLCAIILILSALGEAGKCPERAVSSESGPLLS